MLSALKAWARALKRDVVAVWIAARDRRTPMSARILAGCIAAYALSPIDLIPDFIPVLGYLDDLLIVPAGLWLVVRLIPARLMAEYRARAVSEDRPRSRIGAAAVIAVWVLGAALSALLFWNRGGAG